jgi:hypothetical protein
VSRTLTLQTLIDEHACPSQAELFGNTFGDSVEVTPELCLSVADQFDWDWASRNLLFAWADYDPVRASARADYDRARATALADYDRAGATAWADYVRATAPARADYVRARATTQADYNRATAPAWADYSRARATAWADYVRAKAFAFGKCYAEGSRGVQS